MYTVMRCQACTDIDIVWGGSSYICFRFLYCPPPCHDRLAALLLAGRVSLLGQG